MILLLNVGADLQCHNVFGYLLFGSIMYKYIWHFLLNEGRLWHTIYLVSANNSRVLRDHKIRRGGIFVIYFGENDKSNNYPVETLKFYLSRDLVYLIWVMAIEWLRLYVVLIILFKAADFICEVIYVSHCMYCIPSVCTIG